MRRSQRRPYAFARLIDAQPLLPRPGHAFVVAGLAFHRSMAVFAVVKRHYRAVMIVGGGLLVATGILEITGLWNTAVQHLQTLLPGSTIL
ncbi:MAG: hypothetical protein DLM61_01840 [Pseudonocardiales bacterium]|nr:MAG: hypothetical protein DLM61_01840 [Pseudonocardiales bacterium]